MPLSAAVAARGVVNFWWMTRKLSSLTHCPKRSLELLENVLIESFCPTWRNHCNNGLSASRAQKSRWPSPVTIRAMFARSANTLKRAKRSRRLALVAIFRSVSAQLMKSCDEEDRKKAREWDGPPGKSVPFQNIARHHGGSGGEDEGSLIDRVSSSGLGMILADWRLPASDAPGHGFPRP